jgi:hypothetical protein
MAARFAFFAALLACAAAQSYPPPPATNSFTCGANSVEGLGSLPTFVSTAPARRLQSEESISAASRALKEFRGGGRELEACTSGCLSPRYINYSSYSGPTYIRVTYTSFNTGYSSTNLIPIAFSVCIIIGCNYRATPCTFVAGDTVGKIDFVYSLVFYSVFYYNQLNLSNLTYDANWTDYPRRTQAALPSLSQSTPGTISWAMVQAVDGAQPQYNATYTGA